MVQRQTPAEVTDPRLGDGPDLLQGADTFVGEAGIAAQNSVINTTPATSPSNGNRIPAKRTPNTLGQNARNVLFASAGVLGVAGAAAGADHLLPQETLGVEHSAVAPGGNGVNDAVGEAIDKLEAKGVPPADDLETNDVEAQATAIAEQNGDSVNGVVQPGTPIEVTATKSPIFGNIGYHASDPND